MPTLGQQGHELGNGRKRTPLVKTLAPNQRVLAHRTRIDLVRHLFEANRTDRNVVDRDVPLGNVPGANRRSDGNRERQAGMVACERRACRSRSLRQPARCRGRPTRWHRRRTSTNRRRRSAGARGRCLMPERRRGLGLARDLVETVRSPGGNGDVGIASTSVDQDLVIALTARKADDTAPDFLVRDLVLGVAAIALESHRLHRLWASKLTCAISSLASTES